jgi:hypothetical protein
MVSPCLLDGPRSAPGFQRSHGWLCLGPIILTLLDYSLTLIGQPAAYWEGNFLHANEGSSLLRWCLHQHPLIFVAAAVGLTSLFCLLILYWPPRAAKALAAWLMGAHAYGVATWVWGSLICGPAACVALLYFCWSVLNATATRLPAERAAQPVAL